MTTYPQGAFFVTPVHGRVGWLIGLGQALAGAPSRYCHAGVIVSPDGGTIEAQPGGARPGNVTNYPQALICDGPVQQWLADPAHAAIPNAEQYVRGLIATQAVALRGRPYSWLDYAALAALHLHLPDGWIRRRVQSSGHLICSQLVDLVYRRCGITLYPDGRLPGDVMPSDLAALAEDWRNHDPAA